jgi:hypothetical protein
MPSVVLYAAPERHVRGVALGIPPLLEQILDLKVRAAQVEQLYEVRPQPFVVVSG